MATFTVSVFLPSVASKLTHLASAAYGAMMSVSLNHMAAFCPCILDLAAAFNSSYAFLLKVFSSLYFDTTLYKLLFPLLAVPSKFPFLALSSFSSL